MDIPITIEIPEELVQHVEARAAAAGVSVSTVIRNYLEKYVSAPNTALWSEALPQFGARFIKLSEFDPNYRLTD